jgi:hypothetical protein
MARVEKKVWPGYIDLIESGQKSYDWRLDDFEIHEGDVLVLREWDPETKEYTGRHVEKTVGYVGKWKPNEPFWSTDDVLSKGFQVISLL